MANCTQKANAKEVSCVLDASKAQKKGSEISWEDQSSKTNYSDFEAKVEGESLNTTSECKVDSTVYTNLEFKDFEIKDNECSGSQVHKFTIEELEDDLECDTNNLPFKLRDPNFSGNCKGEKGDDELECIFVLNGQRIREDQTVFYERQELTFTCKNESNTSESVNYKIIIPAGNYTVEEDCGLGNNSYIVQPNKKSSSGLSGGGIAAICCGGAAVLIGAVAGVLLCKGSSAGASGAQMTSSVAPLYNIPKLHDAPLPPRINIAHTNKPPVVPRKPITTVQPMQAVQPIYNVPTIQPVQSIEPIQVIQPLETIQPVQPIVDLGVIQPAIDAPVIQGAYDIPLAQQTLDVPLGQVSAVDVPLVQNSLVDVPIVGQEVNVVNSGIQGVDPLIQSTFAQL